MSCRLCHIIRHIFLCLGAALRRRRKSQESRDRLEDRTRVEVASHNFSAGGPRVVVSGGGGGSNSDYDDELSTMVRMMLFMLTMLLMLMMKFIVKMMMTKFIVMMTMMMMIKNSGRWMRQPVSSSLLLSFFSPACRTRFYYSNGESKCLEIRYNPRI